MPFYGKTWEQNSLETTFPTRAYLRSHEWRSWSHPCKWCWKFRENQARGCFLKRLTLGLSLGNSVILMMIICHEGAVFILQNYPFPDHICKYFILASESHYRRHENSNCDLDKHKFTPCALSIWTMISAWFINWIWKKCLYTDSRTTLNFSKLRIVVF
jgi:hypothetical protein